MKGFILTLPMLIGFIIDIILGDPYSLPHPIRAIGTLISKFEKFVRSRGEVLSRLEAIYKMRSPKESYIVLSETDDEE